MGLMDGKTVLIFGVANKNSIAWGIAQRLADEGAELAFSYAIPKLERRVRPLAESVGATFIEECDVTDDAAVDALFEKLGEKYDKIDGMVHAIAFAPREDMDGNFRDISREGFKLALDISAYSLILLTRKVVPLMTDGGAIVSMTYYASEKVFPRYHVMAVAKAALECETRYLAADLGPMGIRVNAISAGPIKTLAAAGVPGFRDMLKLNGMAAPLRRNVEQEELGDAALYLMSDMSRAVTGEVHYVDAGYNVLGMTLPFDKIDQIEIPDEDV